MRLAKEILKVSEINPESGALVSYNTTFCEQCLKIKKLFLIKYYNKFKITCEDFFVSTLTIKNIFLWEKPAFPVIFMIHKTKQKARHEGFFHLADKFLNLSQVKKTQSQQIASMELLKPWKKWIYRWLFAIII